MFYDKFNTLCNEKGKTPASVARAVGFSRSIITKWKNEGSSPNMKTLVKIAEYFGVSTDYFREPIVIDTSIVSGVVTDAMRQKEKPPTMDGKTFEMVTLLNQLTTENMAKAFDYIQYLLSTQR